jgi:hypothetical protein
VHFVRKHLWPTVLVLAVTLAIGIGGYEVKRFMDDTFNVSLARDAKTDEYLGEVVSEQTDKNTGRVVAYRIERNNGNVIARTCRERHYIQAIIDKDWINGRSE